MLTNVQLQKDCISYARILVEDDVSKELLEAIPFVISLPVISTSGGL